MENLNGFDIICYYAEDGETTTKQFILLISWELHGLVKFYSISRSYGYIVNISGAV